MNEEDETDAARTLSVENAGPVVQHGDLELTGGLVAGRDLTVHGPVNVLADDGAPFGDQVTRPGRAAGGNATDLAAVNRHHAEGICA